MTNLLAEELGVVTLLVLKSETNALKLSREYFYSRITIKNAALCTQSVFICFLWLLWQKRIVSLSRIHRFFFVVETYCVFCKVRNEFVSNNWTNVRLWRGKHGP